MKLIYVFIGASKKHSSVQEKVINQVIELNNNGIQTEGWFFTTEVITDELLNENIILKPLKDYNKNSKYFTKQYRADYFNGQVNNAIKKASFDLLFIRHYRPTINYLKLLFNYSKKVFLYIPSNVIPESYQERKANRNTSIIGNLLSWYEHFIFNYVPHLFMYIFILPKLRGVVLFTPEFASIIKKKSLGRARTFYNRDGADCRSHKMRVYEQVEPDTYKLIFLKGSSMQQPWTGLDRLVESIKHYSDLNFHLYITGKVIDPENYNYSFITLTGKLEENELNELINRVDIGVSNLANYLIGFSETTNLKSRDYFARGLPFIQSNTMPDVTNTIADKYYLLIPNDNSIIDLERVKKFINQMRMDKSHSLQMREFAEKNLSWESTVKELSEIILKN